MNKVLAICFSFFLAFTSKAQDAELLSRQLNYCIEKHSTEEATPFIFFKQSGALEQRIGSKLIRFNPGELANIEVKSTEAGYAVNTNCKEHSSCFNVIKQDASTSTMQSNTYFFNDAGIANFFAKSMQGLSAIYNAENPSSISYFKTASGVQPMYTAPTAVPKIEEPTNTPAVTSKKAADDFLKVDDGDEPEPTPTRKTKTTKEEEDIEDKEAERKPLPNSKSKSTTPPVAPTDPMDDTEDTGMDCKKITQLLAAAQGSFKRIEGKETNPGKKINESTLKMKGAKKNYLSWFQQKRVFIAEYKYNNYFDVLSDAFDNLQSTLDECLGADWDSEDMSGNEEYSNLEGDVKDIEYSNSNDSSMPKIRLLLLPDGKRYVLFMRVQ